MGSQAHTAANVRYNRSRDNIMIRPDKATGQRIRAAAAAASMPIQRYVLAAVLDYMDRHGG